MRSLATRVLNTTAPFSGPFKLIRLLPGVVLAVIVLTSLWLALPAEHHGALAVATVLTVAIYAAMLLPWHRWPDAWQVALPIAGLGPVAAFDYVAGMFYLGALSVIWVSLFHSFRAVLLTVGVYLVVIFVPRLVAPEAYPAPASMVTLVVAAALIVTTTALAQLLVTGARQAMAAATDATDRAEAARQMVDAYLQHIGALLVVLDPEGRLLLFNRAMEEATGAKTEDIVGQWTWDPDDAEAEARQSFARVLAGESPVVTEGDMPTLLGEVRRVIWNTTALTDGEGNVTRVISVGQDVTAQRQAEAALRDALAREKQAADRLRELDRVKSDFVATVSHDLRTPLTSIIGNTELLLDGDAGELAAMQEKLMGTIERNARRLDTLVGDLLLLSKVESGTMRLNLAPVSVREVVDGALESLERKWSPDVELEVKAPDNPVLITGDHDQLERVITNLLSNALKFTPPGGRVTVNIDVDSEHARLSVSDTGIGIPEEELDHVFDRFFRTSRSQKINKPGTGLGLTIAKSIVDMHGGSIAASANPGGGTVFTITLPRLVDAEVPAADSAQ